MKANNKLAVIFDMDGVVVNNTKYHVITWVRFAKQLGKVISAKTARQKFMGRLGREILKELVHKNINKKELQKLDSKREAYYRKI
ncbi:MAG TPA: HAD hydrolase-like protein, partial [Candidatus Limnocylindria bacterium]|nr:HAD hydrolase-like protein [Candidatus Limnocylindria bacterium]